MRSRTLRSESRAAPRITRSWCAPMSFDMRAIAASAAISSTVLDAPDLPRASNGRFRKCSTPITGVKSTTAPCSGRAISGASTVFSCTPSVFGRISVNCSIANVNASENASSHSSPQSSSNCAPAMAAPIVCAVVLRMRMTAIGRSMRFLKLRQIAPARGCRSLICATWLGVRLSSTASMSEHANDTPNATARLITKMVIERGE